LLAELEERPVGYHQVVTSLLTILLVDVARLTLPGLSGPALRSEPVLASAFEFIEEHFSETISLDDVAAAAAVSPGHLSRLFRRVTGRSVNVWIADRRMVEARRLLLTTDDKIEVVARRVGYADPSVFRQRFRRAHDASPAAWRATCASESPDAP